MPQQRGKLKNSGKPLDIAEVDLFDKDPDTGEYVANGKSGEFPSLLYFESGKWCVVNDFFPDEKTGMKPGLYVCATE